MHFLCVCVSGGDAQSHFYDDRESGDPQRGRVEAVVGAHFPCFTLLKKLKKSEIMRHQSIIKL